MSYPFSSPITGAPLDKSTLAFGGTGREDEITTDGVAHVGMIPDFVQEMRVLGMSDQELQPLYHGAEAYIRSRETAVDFRLELWGRAGPRPAEHLPPAAPGGHELRAQDLTGGAELPTITNWTAAVAAMKSNGCQGFLS